MKRSKSTSNNLGNQTKPKKERPVPLDHGPDGGMSSSTEAFADTINKDDPSLKKSSSSMYQSNKSSSTGLSSSGLAKTKLVSSSQIIRNQFFFIPLAYSSNKMLVDLKKAHLAE
jgi:hypothetical protein